MPNLAVDVDSWARSACYPRSTFYPLSDGHSTLSRRITRTCFRTCSACRPRSQARLHSCALGTIANRPERTFVRLRYILGGDRPSQTAHLTRSFCLIRLKVRPPARRGQYSKGDSTKAGASVSKSPAYPLRSVPTANAKLQ